MKPSELLREALAPHLSTTAQTALDGALAEVAGGVSSVRFGTLLAGLSRHIKSRPLELGEAVVERGLELVPDWSIERWSTLETGRVVLILGRSDLASEAAAQALEDAFKFADEGETCALAKSLPLLPAPERFVWRAGECCRSNMRTVFESTACDSPYAARYFDDVAWKQTVIKALFVGAPLWRVRGLDGRLDEDLARMALDLVDERRSAGRPIPPDLWLCLGGFAGERAERALEDELQGAGARQRAAVGLAFARRGESARAADLAATEDHPIAARILRAAAEGRIDQELHRALEDPSLVAAHA
ncbi:EboA domain-containing protein [Engelhardtia mirabilis]|uniref:Uncharacterized protein n=1 Tax=Engelhardtia mirabilis TaxID=2528011 RepID=A0A518BLX9_9BACT|nr:hypothetical protein Pla133_30800 [Planctomycetes bacterium Pla133]QDV02315.1 hypothetical protein Pla86_30790 [Planctomycetes bacterium Pla86]